MNRCKVGLRLEGLGYDFSTDDYKIVRAYRPYVSDQTQVDVLALKSNIWRKIQGLQPGVDISCFGKGPEAGIYLNGALHWLAMSKTGERKTHGIFAFDMVKETFYQLVALPDQEDDNIYNSCVLALRISGDCLCLFIHGDCMEVWVLKEYGVNSSWTRLFSVEPEIEDYDVIYYHMPLFYTKSGKVLIDYDGNKLMWYDPNENTSKTVALRDELQFFDAVNYIESLVSPYCYSATSM